MQKMEKNYKKLDFEKSPFFGTLWHTDELQIESCFQVVFTEDSSVCPYLVLFFHKEILYC